MAEKEPNEACLIFEGDVLTYSEVNARANQVARVLHLRCPAIQEGKAVGLMLQKSFELIISMLGVMKAGGAYVPLDPDYPSERLAMYVEDSKMVALLA
jgi:surfactin family lipopeptide synthetase A